MNKRQKKIAERNRKHHEEIILKTRGIVGSRKSDIVKPKHKKTKKKVKYKKPAKTWISYQAYCRSDEFKALKKKVYKRYGDRCYFDGCDNKAHTIHHLKYRRWGTEKVTDCRPICRIHHFYGMHNDIAVNKMLDSF